MRDLRSVPAQSIRKINCVASLARILLKVGIYEPEIIDRSARAPHTPPAGAAGINLRNANEI